MGNTGYRLHTHCPTQRDTYEKCQKTYLQHMSQYGSNITPTLHNTLLQSPAQRDEIEHILNNKCRDEFEDYKSCIHDVFMKKQNDFQRKKHGLPPLYDERMNRIHYGEEDQPPTAASTSPYADNKERGIQVDDVRAVADELHIHHADGNDMIINELDKGINDKR